MTRELGHMQQYVLELLREQGPWPSNWRFGDPVQIRKIMVTLKLRGLVTEEDGVYTIVEGEK